MASYRKNGNRVETVEVAPTLAESVLHIFTNALACRVKVLELEGRVRVMVPDAAELDYAEKIGASLQRCGHAVDVIYAH